MTTITSETPAEQQVAAAPPRPGSRRLYLAGVLLLLGVLAALTFLGISYRRWGWDFTDPGRFRGDIERNYNFGVTSLESGFLNMHENQVRDKPDRNHKFDYPPLRLLTFEIWAASKQWGQKSAPEWTDDYAFHAGLMGYYTLLEWLASIAAFFIVWHWVRRCARLQQAALPPPAAPVAVSRWRGVLAGLMGFSLLWFDPGVLIIAHGWPSPNMWVLPFYLWAVLFCLWDRWFIAGAVLAVGAMVQGQLLLVVAIFVLWPLFAGEWSRILRIIAGFGLAFMLIASGWMFTLRPDINLPGRVVNWPAVTWVTSSVALLAIVGLRASLRTRLRWPWFVPAAAAAAVALSWPALHVGDALLAGTAVAAAVGLVALFWYCGWGIKRYVLAAVAATCLLLCMWFYGASTAWWDEGFLYGAERFPYVGSDMFANFPTILTFVWGWRDIHEIVFTIPPAWLWHWPVEPTDVTIRQVLLTVFIALFVANGFVIARQWRRGRRNLLVALTLPWVLFYTVLPQMSPRYPVYIAGIGAICVGYRFIMPLLIWIFSALTVVQTGACMMNANRHLLASSPSENWFFNSETHRVLVRMIPALSWAEVLAAGVLLWIAFSLRQVRCDASLGRDASDERPNQKHV